MIGNFGSLPDGVLPAARAALVRAVEAAWTMTTDRISQVAGKSTPAGGRQIALGLEAGGYLEKILIPRPGWKPGDLGRRTVTAWRATGKPFKTA